MDTRTETSDGQEYTTLQWVAPEYTQYERGPIWYSVMTVVFIGLFASAIWLKQYFFAVLVVVMCVALIIYVSRKSPTHQYTVTNEGVYIDGVLYAYSKFHAFGVIKDHAFDTIRLIPNGRLGVAISLHFPEEIGEQLVDTLAQYLPMKNMKADLFDIILHGLKL